jgi:hypothetical protein
MTDWTKYNKIYERNFAFNDSSRERNKGKYLIAFECFSIHPSNYDISLMKQYKGVLTWNTKYYNELVQNNIMAYKINGFPRFDDHYKLEHYVTYDYKINGVVLICRHRDSYGMDISGERLRVLNQLKSNHIKCHTYGKTPYGDTMYQGVIGNNVADTLPSSYAKLKKLNEYKYSLCFENCYHEKWSYDYITEKIFDCFKAKTIPIYYGCFNIENYISPKLFIDYRKFNITSLSQYLNRMSKQEYIDMTEAAFEFEQTCRLGKLYDFDAVLMLLEDKK